MYFIFDIGGTKMRLAVSKDGEELTSFRIVPTPSNFDEAVKSFTEILKELKGQEKINKTVGGVPGALNKSKDTLLRSPHLPDWVGKPLKTIFSEITESETVLENDAALAGLGESVSGAGKGFEIAAYLTISTGIGGVRVIDGKLDKGMYGFEPGHHLLDIDGSLTKGTNAGSGLPGEFESLASGSGIAKRFGMSADLITDQGVWDHINWILANGIANTILFWSPEVVILGGGVVESGKVSIDQIKNYLPQLLTIFPELPDIRKSTLQDLGGLYGALACLNS